LDFVTRLAGSLLGDASDFASKNDIASVRERTVGRSPLERADLHHAVDHIFAGDNAIVAFVTKE
jgi:hypothetical protein